MATERTGYLEGGDLHTFARQEVAGKCASCRFWSPNDEPTWREEAVERHEKLSLPMTPNLVEYQGECRRNAPTHILHDIYPGSADSGAIWPDTYWNDWCGDYCQARDGMPFESESAEEP